MSNHYCYILRNKTDNRTYNGYTNKPMRRIRQHNQELVGGAKYTKNFGQKDWEIYVLITGFPDKINALQCEWRIRHPDGKKKRRKKYTGPAGRVTGLNQVLKLDQWTSQSSVKNDFPIEVWIVEEYAGLITNVNDNVKINIVDAIELSDK